MVSSPERDVRETFRRSGYTLTSQRRAVLDALKDFKVHPSAEEVYLLVKKRNPRVALGTVYQALSVLEEIGLIEAKRWSETPLPHSEFLPFTSLSRTGFLSSPPGYSAPHVS